MLIAMRLSFGLLLAASLLAGCTSKAGSAPSPSAVSGASEDDSNTTLHSSAFYAGKARLLL